MSEEAGKRKGYKRLSIEELRGFKGCENYTDEEAVEIIDTLEQMTIVLFKLYQKNKKIEDNENNLKTLKQFAKGKREELQTDKRYCVVYTRVSTKEQAETQSLEWQKKFCNDYAAKNSLEVLGYFGGTYESAKNDE